MNKELNIINIEIKKQKNIVEDKNKEILLKNEELNAQNDEIIKQRDEIYEQKRQITDSIAYASRIQSAVLYNKVELNSLFSDAFIYFKPRDVVSGDFYWYREFNELVIVTAADCTGHGVPGAFMSLLGVSALEEIVFSNNICQPDEILERLREMIKASLKQSMGMADSQDGIDMAICTIDKKQNQIAYAGANNPLFLIRNNELTIHEPCHNPVGIDIVENKFTKEIIEYHENDIIYLFSDGFIDQFNMKREKFKTNRFKKLLLEIQNKNMNTQKQLINDAFLNWKGHFKQIDDVLIIGIKF